jgi:hypothetical protein
MGWPLAAQELVWTLVPALVLVTLTVASEIPRGWGKMLTDLATRTELAASRDADRDTVWFNGVTDGPRSRR